MIGKFINTGFHSGQFNMDFDYALATQVRDGDHSQVVRVYGWKPAAVSIGFNQHLEDFDLEKLQLAGIHIVRRPTGGRAILHSNELTYSVIMPIDDRGLRGIYQSINQALLRGLQLLGIDADLTPATDNLRVEYRNPEGIPCFSSSAKCEIQFEGRKLIGSAQRRYGSVILQHGSILLGPQHRKIVDFLAPCLDDLRSEVESRLISGTIDIETILGRAVTFDEAARTFKQGFEEHWEMKFEESATEELFATASIAS